MTRLQIPPILALTEANKRRNYEPTPAPSSPSSTPAPPVSRAWPPSTHADDGHLIDFRDYTRRYATADFVDATYRNRMASIVRQLCHKHHLGERSSDALLTHDTYTPPLTTRKPPTTVHTQSPQANLFAAS